MFSESYERRLLQQCSPVTKRQPVLVQPEHMDRFIPCRLGNNWQTSFQVLPENSGRCVRIYKIPQSNLSAGAYQRQSVSADQVVTSYFSDRPNSIRQRLAELRLDSKSRGGGDDETL